MTIKKWIDGSFLCLCLCVWQITTGVYIYCETNGSLCFMASLIITFTAVDNPLSTLFVVSCYPKIQFHSFYYEFEGKKVRQRLYELVPILWCITWVLFQIHLFVCQLENERYLLITKVSTCLRRDFTVAAATTNANLFILLLFIFFLKTVLIRSIEILTSIYLFACTSTTRTVPCGAVQLNEWEKCNQKMNWLQKFRQIKNHPHTGYDWRRVWLGGHPLRRTPQDRVAVFVVDMCAH